MKILLAYDGLERSKHALEETAKLAENRGADVTILSVVDESEARASKSGGHRFLAPHAHEDVAVAHKYLAEAGVAAEMKVVYGDPVDEIRREALDGRYDLIVAGSRELGPVGRVVLGSVSARLVKEAPCSVLVAGEGAAVHHEPPIPVD